MCQAHPELGDVGRWTHQGTALFWIREAAARTQIGAGIKGCVGDKVFQTQPNYYIR